MVSGELKLQRPAHVHAAKPMRHALVAFLSALEVPEVEQVDVITAVGEALANAVEHGYRGSQIPDVSLRARLDANGTLAVDVIDGGRHKPVVQHIDRGFGLRIVRSIAQSIELDADEADGTALRMFFKLSA
ncbi:MAG TPA: ATP-binding protein [Candidatus Tumulicola sp.]